MKNLIEGGRAVKSPPCFTMYSAGKRAIKMLAKTSVSMHSYLKLRGIGVN
jgi:hypothetical protein